MTQLPEIREADAPPHIAAIYADIREAAVLPQVNLIFRYFATEPGVLEWVWQTLRPLYVSQELADASHALTKGVVGPGRSPIGDVLSVEDRIRLKTVLAAYNSGNPQNLIGLTAFKRLLESRGEARDAGAVVLSPRQAGAAAAASSFPPLKRREDLDRETMALVERLASRHKVASGVIPSLYLHLAYWPAALAAADTFLEPIMASPDWSDRVAAILDESNITAERLAGAVELVGNPPDDAIVDRITATLAAFVGATIPEMVVVGGLLARE